METETAMLRPDRPESRQPPRLGATKSVGERTRPCVDISCQLVKPGCIRPGPRPDNEVQGTESRERAATQDLAQPPTEAIARHGRLAVTWHNHSKPRVSQLVAAPVNVHSWRAAAVTSALYRRNVRRARQAPGPRNPPDLNALRAWKAPVRRGVFAPSCGVGSMSLGPNGYPSGSESRACWSGACCGADMFSSSQ